MPYTYLSKEEFDNNYQVSASLLSSYIKENENNVANLRSIEQTFTNQNLFVLNGENGKSFLHEAAARQNLPLITLLQKIGHDINLQDNQYKTPLYDACSQLKLASVITLLNYGANPNLGNSHLMFQGNRNGIDGLVTYQGETIPLVATIESTATVTAEQLTTALTRMQSVEVFSGLTTEEATKHAAALIVKKLIEKGVRTNLQTGLDNFSALHRAIIHTQSLTVKELIHSGQVNPYLVDRDGETGLHMVANYRSQEEKEYKLAQIQMQEEKEIAELIIPHLEALDIQEIKYGNTPLHTAVIRSNRNVVKSLYQKDYLFQHRKILSIQNNAGNTALHEAVKVTRRGPEVLKLLLRVATNDDLAIINNEGKTAKQMAEHLLQESSVISSLTQEIKVAETNLDTLLNSLPHRITQLHNLDDKTVKTIFEWKPLSQHQLIEFKKAINHLNTAIDNLETNPSFDTELSDFEELASDIHSLSYDLKHYEQIASSKKGNYHSVLIETADELRLQADKLAENIDNDLISKSYLEILTSVRQEEYFSWKNQILELPTSFPNLPNININSPAYQADLAKANRFFYNAQEQLYKGNNNDAKKYIEEAIGIYHQLNQYQPLEEAYQFLAKTAVNREPLSIARYEEVNRNKLLSLEYQEKLQGHLALAGLYKELKEQTLSSSSPLPSPLSIDDLVARESFHYYASYKLTQGHPDSAAHVVLQRELGIANNAKLGTYNIQQCVAVIAFDPISKKVVLSHFDKYSGPLSFVDQLLNEFPGQSKIHLYMSGARDRVSLASSTSTISDNNIEQVLKQIYAEKNRFVIQSSDLGDKPSPEAVVFDVKSQRLIHAVPNLSDSSLESREVNFQLQRIKGDYLRPLNPVDFTRNEIDREISFSIEQQQQIAFEYTRFTKNTGQTEAWNHQIFYPLMAVNNELARVNKPNFSQGLLTARLNTEQDNGNLLMDIDEDVASDLDITQLRCIGGNRRKRESNCVLDSQAILDDLKSLSEAKQAEFLHYISTRTVGGKKQKEVSKLIVNNKIIKHLGKVSKLSSHLMGGIFAEGAIANLLKGDPNAAINLASFTGSSFLSTGLSTLLDEEGKLVLATTKKVFRGKFLRASAPFARRGTALLIGYDFYNQIKALQNDSSNTDAWVGAISDGIFLATDLIEIGIEVAEISSEAIALMGISAVTGPIGETVGAIVMLGSQIYKSVETVDRENHFVHLTAFEKFKEGWRAFLDLEPESYIQNMLDEVVEYDHRLAEKLELLKNLPGIKHLIFPAIEKIGEKRRVIQEKSRCGGGLVFPPRDCYRDKIVCDPIFNESKDNIVYFKDKFSGLELTRENITPPSGTQLLCLPTITKSKVSPIGFYACKTAMDFISNPITGVSKTLCLSIIKGRNLFPTVVYLCHAAIGLSLINDTTRTMALYDLGEGEDHATGFRNISNVFIVNNGAKDYVGGAQDDTYIVKASEVVTALNKEGGLGGLDGQEGVDTLLLQGFRPLASKIIVNFNEGVLKYSHKTLAIANIEKLIGGDLPISVVTACDTQEIDTTGGSTFTQADTVLIPKNSSCDYVTKFYLKPHSVLNNKALQGHFTYTILPGAGMILVNLTTEKVNEKLASSGHLRHQFVFNTEISDLYAISSTTQTITFHFLEHKIKKLLRTIQTISIAKNNATNDITLHYQLKPGAFLDAKYLSLLPEVLKSPSSQKALKNLLKNCDANENVTVSNRSKLRHVIFNLLKSSGFIPNDFKLDLNYCLLNKPFFYFISGAELKIINGNSYLFYRTDQSIDDIMTLYSPMARRLNMICIISTLLNQRVLIGHYGRQVMYNDENAKETHFNSNGGQGLFIIEPPSSFRLFVNNIVLHRANHSDHIDTLDFRRLSAKLQTELETSANAFKLIFISKDNAHQYTLVNRYRSSDNEYNKPENDLLLILGIVRDGAVLDFITVRLKDAMLTHWYKEYLHIILNVAPQKIVGQPPNLYLEPIPLKLDNVHQLISIGVEDVEKNTEIIIPRTYHQFNFYHHNKTNLIGTNILSSISETEEPLSIILKNFYKEPKLATLSFKFSNKKVVLAEKLTALNTVPYFEEVKEARENALKKESIAIITSKPIPFFQASQANHFNTSNLIRRRRSVESDNVINSFTQNTESIQERADAYYDHYDQRKEKCRLKKFSHKSRKGLAAYSMHPTNDPTKQPISTTHQLNEITFNRPSIKKSAPRKAYSKAAQRTDVHPPTSEQPIIIQKNTNFYKRSLFIKKNPMKVRQSNGKANRFKEIANTPESSPYTQRIAATKLSSRHQSHQQQTQSEGISRVTASIDIQSTLFALSYAAKCLTGKNNRPIVNPKIRRIQQQLERRKQSSLPGSNPLLR